MGKLSFQRSFGIASPQIFNHLTASAISKEVLRKASSMGLQRIAGNIFESPCSHELWKVRGGSIIRLTGNEVDYNEHLAAAPADDPAGFLDGVLGDLVF